MIELISLTIFLACILGMMVMVRKKMPLLRTVPEQLIEESFITRPPRVHTILERAKSLYQEKYHHYLVFSFLERLITTLRDIIVYIEQGLFWLLRFVQDRQNGSGISKRLRYLNRLNAWRKKNGNGAEKEKEESSSADGPLPSQ